MPGRPGPARRGGDPVEQVVRVEGDRRLVAVEARGDPSRSPVPGPRSGPPGPRCPEPNVSRTGLARSATRETRRTASISEAAGISARQPYSGGEPGLVPDELPRDQPAGQPPAAAVERDHPLHRPGIAAPAVPASSGAANATDTGTPGTMTRAASARVRPGTRAIARIPGLCGRPVQVAHGQPVPVGGRQRHHVAADVQAHAGEHGQRVVAAGGREHLRHGRGQVTAVDRAGQRRGGRQFRVLGRGQRDQRELGAAAS